MLTMAISVFWLPTIPARRALSVDPSERCVKSEARRERINSRSRRLRSIPKS